MGNRGKLPEDVNWPPCMEVFMDLENARQIIEEAGFEEIEVLPHEGGMESFTLDESIVARYEAEQKARAGGEMMGCSHAKKAAQRRIAEARERQRERQRSKAGVHWGNPEYKHLEHFDMDKLCARTLIY